LYHILNVAAVLCVCGGWALWRFANCSLLTTLLCATVGFYTFGGNSIWHKRAQDFSDSNIRGRAAVRMGIAVIVVWTIVLAWLVFVLHI